LIVPIRSAGIALRLQFPAELPSTRTSTHFGRAWRIANQAAWPKTLQRVFLAEHRTARGCFILVLVANARGIAMTRKANQIAARLIAGACLGLGTLLVSMTAANAVDARVRSACTGDYLNYCSQHDPDGKDVRRCMRSNGPKLSSTCLNALVAAGEVSKKEVRRRSASAR
jgi:hypothetical protein